MQHKIIAVNYTTPNNTTSSLKLKIVFKEYDKPDLGGLKDLQANREYYHAFSQTDQPPTDHATKYHRDTQTVDTETKGLKPKREAASQTLRGDLFIDTAYNKVMVPKKYFDSELWLQRRTLAARFIQKMIRGYFARKRMLRIKELKDRIVVEKTELKKQGILDEETAFKKRIQKRIAPKVSNDFEELYNELSIWKRDQLKVIKSNKAVNDDEKRKAYADLLNKEIEVLQAIDRMKASAAKVNKEEAINAFLEKLGKPKRWLIADKRYAEVVTPLTENAQRLYSLYRELTDSKVGIEERLDILIRLKQTIEKDDSDLCFEIKQLINREADMIQRRRPLAAMEGLNSRISNLFLRYIEQPRVNPEIERFKEALDRLINPHKC